MEENVKKLEEATKLLNEAATILVEICQARTEFSPTSAYVTAFQNISVGGKECSSHACVLLDELPKDLNVSSHFFDCDNKKYQCKSSELNGVILYTIECVQAKEE